MTQIQKLSEDVGVAVVIFSGFLPEKENGINQSTVDRGGGGAEGEKRNKKTIRKNHILFVQIQPRNFF